MMFLIDVWNLSSNFEQIFSSFFSNEDDTVWPKFYKVRHYSVISMPSYLIPLSSRILSVAVKKQQLLENINMVLRYYHDEFLTI